MKSSSLMGRNEFKAAFTLIELIIVVAIIAILASIGVANFLEAQTRSKVSRAQSDLRAINTALESYRVDYPRYPLTPLDSITDRNQRLSPLTTPVAYLSSLPYEAFPRNDHATYAFWSAKLADAMKFSPIFFYLPDEKEKTGRWALFSRGPDVDYEAAVEESQNGLLVVYDPTNGSVSNGDIMRFGP